MAEELKNNNLISKTNSGFPDYLDFDKLRREGIDYLGKLGGKLWTDHNVHDPGITILEVLCYALLDLGYRTNLPEKDLFTRSPDDKSKDNNFFTPAAILSCNPLTITDFRKLLIDIEGVKNAWLEIARDQKDSCRPADHIREQPPCVDFLNGLYHVYIDLEKDVEKEFRNDAEAKKKYLDTIIEKVKRALMAHRNLCEDFVDIFILCKQEIGVCADIELEEGAEAEKVYLAVVETLRTFFSPAPKFYTLQQLLDRHKPIEEIFAGRPYTIEESHGFVDTEEFELLKMRKEIHLSDVYNALFGIEGVKGVRGLRLQSCKNQTVTPIGGWKYHIPENHIPEFSVACSGFQFSRHGMPVFIDFKKFDGLFEINFTHNGKVLYTSPSPYLDCEITRGIYRKDLSDYYSIQNEFPRVYGIAEGGLPGNVSDQRKAQAYQLKAYLLFFDQLLANYLSQLSNIRSLFALSAMEQPLRHTYFINQLTTVPDLQKLLRFNVSETGPNSLGSTGSILVIPVDKNHLLKLKEQDTLKTLEIENIQPYTFATLADQEIAIHQLKNDLHFEQCLCEYVTKNDNCVFYYILTTSSEIALISRKYFADVGEAATNAASVKYIGTFEENYRSFTTAGKSFSFDVELNLLAFAKYLELIVEDKVLFLQRRQGFLDHLLSRFAEQFTDYALLSFDFYTNYQLATKEIKKKEAFLSRYDEISSNRGKAYDYAENNWNNDNVSGFEKKFKAISGIDNWKRHSLCNFVVAEYDPQYAVNLKIAGTNYFFAEEKFDSKEEALASAQSLFNALRDKSNYSADLVSHDNAYQLKISYEKDRWAIYPAKFPSKEETFAVVDNLTNLFTEKPPGQSVFESAYIYIPILNDAEGKRVRKSLEVYTTDAEAKADSLKSVKKIDDRKKWEYAENAPSLGVLYHDEKKTDALSFINTDAFKIDISNTIVGRPDKFTYDLLDKENNFKFRSVKEFDNARKARANADELLALLTDETNYEVFRDDAIGKFLLRIRKNDDIQAITSIESNSLAEAENLQNQILNIAKNNQYFIVIDKIPHGWRFSYHLGYEKNNFYSFHSIKEYDSPEVAAEATSIFNKALPGLQLEETDDELILGLPKKNTIVSAVKWIPQLGKSPTRKIKEGIIKLLEEQKEIKHLSENQDPEAFRKSVDIDDVSSEGLFVYRLVDKDKTPACYTKTFADKKSAATEMKTLAKHFKNKARYLQLCMGGDIIVERKHPATNKIWYRYQLKCLNQFYKSGNLVGKPLVFFESTKRYSTIKEAEEGFAENYLQLIHLASSRSEYGKKISLVEISIGDEDRPIKTDSIVFIPKETLNELGPSSEAAIQGIINLLLTYPIRSVIFKSKEFYQLFPCEKKQDDEADHTDCKKEKEKYVYYFVLSAASSDTEKWQSVNFYDTPEEARKEFNFFLILLYYAGNYYVDCDGCQTETSQYRIYIREVLAESTERFLREQDAWGENGLQKFICVSQTTNSFHSYLRKEDCCYSFYVACGTGLVYHPCKYDTPQKRDDALSTLYRSFQEVVKKNAWRIDNNENTLVLKDGDGVPFAAVHTDNRNNNCVTDRITTIRENAVSNDNYKEVDGRIILQNGSQNVLATSIREGVTLFKWKEMLQLFICYYPIVNTKDEQAGDAKNRYCIEIKLPGFDECKEDAAEEKPCGCDNESTDSISTCSLAWKGNCCYATCAEAEQALQRIMRWLLNYDFYQPVFDCECYSHGIALQFSKQAATANDRQEVTMRNWQSSEIIAVNPQCYPTKELACEAVDRAKELINSEGLHLVEHILLRPRCFPQDCDCPQYTNRCDDETDCRFVWKAQDEDPCSEEEDICFVPGADRYSFIATVALPAWPERFRKPANRRLLENILYREAPAHILLRILWLAPHDFCCFEGKFKKWNRWLAGRKTCIDDFAVCDFLEFLFDRNYECLDECEVCEPCNDHTEQRLPCFAQTNSMRQENSFLNQISDLYCWQEQHCERYQFIPCEKKQDQPGDDTPILLRTRAGSVPSTVEVDEEAPSKTDVEKKDSRSVSRSSKAVVEEMKEENASEEPVVLSSKRKPQVINSRMAKYRASVLQVTEKSKNNLIASKVQSFMTDPQPSTERLEKLVNEILQNKDPKTKGTKKFTKKQVSDLVQSSISYYLDKICFNGKDMKKVAGLKNVIEKIRKAKIKISDVYDAWNFAELKKFEPGLDETEIDKLFDRKVK